MSICYQCFKEINDEKICPYCGFDPAAQRAEYPLALPCGTVLSGRYIIGKVLGQGGFGITYLVQDYQDKKLVAIKEYFPDTLALRSGGTTVSTVTGEREDAFRYGKECFLSEAKTLSQFNGNPNIVSVYSYFEENGTAYFSMEYIEGVSLLTYVRNRGGRIAYEECKNILFPVMDALSAVHAKGIIHRDISPDNIFLTRGGGVKLIDFGAARYSLGDRSRSLDVVLKHGYAPKEQYARHGRQGPYTDVYSLAATMYRCIAVRIPPDSIDRIDEDSIVLPSNLGSDIPPAAEDALMTALAVNPAERYQTMARFKAALEGQYIQRNPAQPPHLAQQVPAGVPVYPAARPVQNAPVQRQAVMQSAAQPPQKKRWVVPVAVASAVAAVVLIVSVIFLLLDSFNKSSSDEDNATSPSASDRSNNHSPDFDSGRNPNETYNPQKTTTVILSSYEGISYESAKAELEKQGFVVIAEKSYSNTVAKGSVISQSPGVGSSVECVPGETEVTLTVSRGCQHSEAGYDQKVVVTGSPGSSTGTFKVYNWEEGEWIEKLSCSCSLGTDGITYNYGEGIKATPKGEFRLGFAISAYSIDTKLEVYHADADTCFVDDTSSSLYNTIRDVDSLPYGVHYDRVGTKLTNGDTYAQIFIEHNGNGRTAAPSRTAGSAITICGISHTLYDTWGCIDISEENMKKLLRLLDPSLDPHIITKN